ncbi:hypothetical protein J830_3092, partial [Acinetobacter baumannii 25691_7]
MWCFKNGQPVEKLLKLVIYQDLRITYPFLLFL